MPMALTPPPAEARPTYLASEPEEEEEDPLLFRGCCCWGGAMIRWWLEVSVHLENLETSEKVKRKTVITVVAVT